MFRIIKDKLLGKKRHRDNELKEDISLSKSIKKNIQIFKNIFSEDETIRYREFTTKGEIPLKVAIIFVDGMANSEIINENILKPLMSSSISKGINIKAIEKISNNIVDAGDVKRETDIYEVVGEILYGSTAIIIDGEKEILLIDTKKWETRAVSQPVSENVVRGPREGFNESIITNLSLIRRKIRNPDLKFNFKEIGVRTKTKICVCYISGVANKKIVNEVHKRLDNIEIDGILESGYIEELIKDSPLSPFATIGHTERPDIVSAKLLEGRVAIVVDGTPFVLTLPYLFIEYFQMNEDYYDNFIFASFDRLLTLVGFFIATSLPSVYTALVTYHQEMIPTPLLLSISALREGLPFPTIVEALVMLLAFEILRVGGIRLPTPLGSSISFVGALIIGQAAVQARIISAPMVIVVALTGITNFLMPKMVGPLIIVRTAFLILSSFLGLYGYIFGVIGLFIHLMSMRSFGIPYTLNLGSIRPQEVKDTSIRAPWWLMYYRPRLIGGKNPVRKKNSQLPEER